MTPRRVGFLCCSCAPPRAEPAGPSVWCTMMFFQGWALATSPQGASQTIFRPGMSGVPDCFAIVLRSGVCATTGATSAIAPTTIARKRKFIIRRPCGAFLVAGSGALAQSGGGLGFRLGRERRGGIIGRVAILALLLGVVERMVGGGDQP